MKKKYFLYLFVFPLLLSCGSDDYTEIPSDIDLQLMTTVREATETNSLSYFTLPDTGDYSTIPQDPKNPITQEKVALGKLLLHETALGKKPKIGEMQGTYSCASCHHASAGFGAGIRQGLGEGGQGFGFAGEGRILNTTVPKDSIDVQPLRSPTILNVAYQDIMLWNGQFGGTGTNAGTEANWTKIQENFLGFEGVEVQAIKGQGVHRLLLNEEVVTTLGYTQLFDAAFPNIAKSERYTTLNAALAIAAYERTLLANKAPWQAWLKGDVTAMTSVEKEGARLFFSTGKCFECHTGPALNDKEFHAYGMGDFDNSDTAMLIANSGFEDAKKGRGGFTKNPDDDYKFKTPTLYNLIDNGGFYGHGGTFTSVKEVIQYKVSGTAQNTEVPTQNLASQFTTVTLTDKEIEALTAFVENGLRDPNLNRYTPVSVNSGQCFPVNDIQAKEDMGCN